MNYDTLESIVEWGGKGEIKAYSFTEIANFGNNFKNPRQNCFSPLWQNFRVLLLSTQYMSTIANTWSICWHRWKYFLPWCGPRC